MNAVPSGEGGFVCGFLKPPKASWREVDWAEVLGWQPEQGLLWVHLDRGQPGTNDYLLNASGINGLARDALLTEETRPRALAMDDGLLLILRGVNLNPGADPEDMVSLRIWADSSRIISTRQRPVMALNDLRRRLPGQLGPQSTGEFIVQVAAGLVDRMSNVLASLDEEEDELEEQIVENVNVGDRTALARIRRQAIALRRYLAPQRDALNRLQVEELTWLDARHRARIREVHDRVIRYVEDLDAIRERAAVIQDELMNRLADRMNRTMYLLTIVATVMLPLGFITGLLGVNVDGIPGSQNTPGAFFILCAVLVLLVLIEVWVLRRLRWF